MSLHSPSSSSKSGFSKKQRKRPESLELGAVASTPPLQAAELHIRLPVSHTSSQDSLPTHPSDVDADEKHADGHGIYEFPIPIFPDEKQSPSSQTSHAAVFATSPKVYKPTTSVLFCLSSRSELVCFTLPAVVVSCASGVIQPILTMVLGKAFDSFTTFINAKAAAGTDVDAIRAAKSHFKHDQVKYLAALLILAGIMWLSSTVAMLFWNMNSEYIVRRLRRKMFSSVLSKKLEWFDLGMGAEKQQDANDDDETTTGSSAGLAGRFAKNTDEVRMATNQTFGLTLQALSTGILCLILGFIRSWKLTLVIFITFPLVLITSSVIERITAPLVHKDVEYTSMASTKVERAVTAIATVKAFNAEPVETASFLALSAKMKSNYNKLTMFWGLRLGIAQFFLLMSFVQGLWFGNHLVQKGEITGGQVTEVFYAIMIASAQFQMIIPNASIIEQGKQAMASLLNLVNDKEATTPTQDVNMPQTATTEEFDLSKGATTTTSPRHSKTLHKRKRSTRVRELRKIQPVTFRGELSFHKVTFWYPSRPFPAPPALKDVSLFLPAQEMTFIVGQSGSGKSTIGALLLGLYTAQYGSIEADEQGIEWLDERWLRKHIGLVSQQSVLFDGTVHDNVAIGALDRAPSAVTRDEVVAACRIALIHDFVRDLPDGYDTMLSGQTGASLSGGQKQRLAIARAVVRNPPVLILDEATSALDVTSRLLVFEAIKRWRANTNGTTIVITHDLSPIEPQDFVYVLKDGVVVEQGYRSDLETFPAGWFSQMLNVQSSSSNASMSEHRSSQAIIPSSNRASQLTVEPGVAGILPGQFGRFIDLKRRSSAMFLDPTLTPTIHIEHVDNTLPYAYASEHSFLPELLAPPVRGNSLAPFRDTSRTSIMALQDAASTVHTRRREMTRDARDAHMDATTTPDEVAIDMPAEPALVAPGFFKVLFRLLPDIPNKWLLCVGFVFCILAGITTPIFSALISQMLNALGTKDASSTLVRSALLILLVAAIDGLAMWLKYSVMQRVAMGWITSLRQKTYTRMLSQDKTFFDRPENTGMRLSNVNVKDVDDARNMVGMITGQFVIVIVMLLFGLIWALVVGWELTLIGFAVAPLMLAVLAWQTATLGKAELVNKGLREDITNNFHTTVSNIKAIRGMSIESVFAEQFESALEAAHVAHRRTALFTGTAWSIGSAMNIAVEGIVIFVASLLVASGKYTFSQMLQVFSLIMFSVLFAAQTMGYVPTLTRATAAAWDLLKLYELTTDTNESRGKATFPVRGNVLFENIKFAYPSRPDTLVLDSVNMRLSRGECVGIVGASGSGKSTLVALLQRLYEPTEGQISLDGTPLHMTNVHFLRSHIAIVSQHPALFNASVSENIAYGLAEATTQQDIERACRQANVHDFIMSLPHGYATNLGESASLISGGQAQRLAIARAILQRTGQPAKEVLILDECTSALDAENQRIVMDTIRSVKQGRTTLIVTHKLDMMKMCDRLIVMDAGKIVEQGSYDQLLLRQGAFAKLASAGEWLL